MPNHNFPIVRLNLYSVEHGGMEYSIIKIQNRAIEYILIQAEAKTGRVYAWSFLNLDAAWQRLSEYVRECQSNGWKLG